MRERTDSKNIKKRKSQDSFLVKQRFQTPLTEQLRYLEPKRAHNRASLSVLELYPSSNKEHKRRVNSLELSPSDLATMEGMKSGKNGTQGKSRSQISNCLSDRNVNIIRDPQKLCKYRKFSSNADLQQQQLCSSVALKQKLSVIQIATNPKPAIEQQPKLGKYSIMVWILAVRKYFGREQRLKQSPTATSITLSTLVVHLQRIKAELESIKFSIERTGLEPDLTREQLIGVIQSHFRATGSQGKSVKKDKIGSNTNKLNYLEVLNCLVQYQLKTASQNGGKDKEAGSSEEHEEVIETARFQQGSNGEEGPKKHKRPYLGREIIGKSIVEESCLTSFNESHEKRQPTISPLTGKSKQSLNPSLSPFSMESKSINNSRSSLHYDSDPALFAKGGFPQAGSSGSSLGMLTLEGKSPRELMESEIYESMQKLGVYGHRKNNISFSLNTIEIEPHAYFEQTVHSFEQLLKKLTKIQSSYLQRLASPSQTPKAIGQTLKANGQTLKGNEEHLSSEINCFLQQLINYRMTLSPESDERYCYFVSWENIGELKEHSFKLMQILLQSTYMRDYLMALEGVKIENSAWLLRSIRGLMHQGLRIVNLSGNGLTDLDCVVASMPDNNALQFLNIGHNHFTDLQPILSKFTKLRQLHASHNLLQFLNEADNPIESLRILDLSYNKIHSELHLRGILSMKSIQILNLVGNPLVAYKEWKSNWKKSFTLDVVYEMDNLYVMSDFGHQKDIAFCGGGSSSRNKSMNCDRQAKQNQPSGHENMEEKLKSRPQLDESQYTNYRKRSVRESNTMQQSLRPFVSNAGEERELPKQKISKIKTFLDGKVI